MIIIGKLGLENKEQKFVNIPSYIGPLKAEPITCKLTSVCKLNTFRKRVKNEVNKQGNSSRD